MMGGLTKSTMPARFHAAERHSLVQVEHALPVSLNSLPVPVQTRVKHTKLKRMSAGSLILVTPPYSLIDSDHPAL